MDTNENGVDRSPVPEMNDKYKDYYELNSEKVEEAGTSTAEVPKESSVASTDEKPASDSSKEEKPKEHTPDYIRRINTLTKRNKSYESELADLRKQIEQLRTPKAEQKMTRDHFLSDEEYLDYRAEQKAKEVIAAKELESLKVQEEQAKRNQEQSGFRDSWVKRTADNFAGDEEGLAQFKQLISESEDDMHQDIHDFISDSAVGPRLLHVLLLRPDLVERYNGMKPISRARALGSLEDEVVALLRKENKQEPQAQKTPATSKAPAPIGQIGNSGNSRELSDDEQYAAYLKKLQTGR